MITYILLGGSFPFSDPNMNGVSERGRTGAWAHVCGSPSGISLTSPACVCPPAQERMNKKAVTGVYEFHPESWGGVSAEAKDVRFYVPPVLCFHNCPRPPTHPHARSTKRMK